MSDETNKDSESKGFKFGQEEIIVPDLAEVWKELYYSTEKAWADAFKDFVSTETFVNMLDKTLEQYLAYEKMSRDTVDKYCEMNPMASKKDIARVAELVVSMEDKLDDMEFQLFDNVRVIADNMLKIVNIQDSFRIGFDSVRNSVESLDTRIKSLEEAVAGQSGSGGQEAIEHGFDRVMSSISSFEKRISGLEARFESQPAPDGQNIVDEIAKLQNQQGEKQASEMSKINSQLETLNHALKDLSISDLSKSLKKIDALEKKMNTISKETKSTRKRSDTGGKNPAKNESAEEPE